MMKKWLFLILMLTLCVCSATARIRLASQPNAKQLIAFVKTGDGGYDVLKEHGCKVFAEWDDLCIAAIPIKNLDKLKQHHGIRRIEANESFSVCLDTTATLLNTDKVWNGLHTPQAYTGKGVVVGIQDIGFDLTHPTFGKGRIKAMWDMLSRDTVGSTMPVGRVYEGEEISTVQHSYDGLEQSHGTHTAGIAAGDGYLFPYKGMAWESDIVLVANGCSSNAGLIDSVDIWKYTDALDVLGFKYIFDYAESKGQPCVISFSEGGPQSLSDGSLMYEALEHITGPGRIIMASAGNSGEECAIATKTSPQSPSLDVHIKSFNVEYVCFATCTERHSDLRLVVGGEEHTYSLAEIASSSDTIICDTINGAPMEICYYPSCFDSQKDVFEVYCKAYEMQISLMTDDNDAMIYSYHGTLGGENAHNACTINAPAAAPAVLAVGSDAYRRRIINFRQEEMEADAGTGGVRTSYSSKGPTLTGIVKPDLLAPGQNIISSYNSFVLEQYPEGESRNWEVENFMYEGRTYPWNANSGTSMSCPMAAGIVALWLQAKPTLTKDDILDVLAHSCRHYDETMTYPNNEYGYGEIDAYAGLLYILGISGIVSHHQIDQSVFPLREGETMTIYTTSGVRVDEMKEGHVYAIDIKSPVAERNGSMLIRK